MTQTLLGTILIVDDEPSVGALFARVLEKEGHQVRTAVDSNTAFHVIEEHRPDVILLDLHLSCTGGGLAFLQHVRALPQHTTTPVAVVTGDYSVDATLTANLRRLGATVYFKPLSAVDVVSITQQLLTAIRPSVVAAARRPTLLLVDDCAAERDLYEIVLQREFTIITASRGEDGIAVATKTHPDAVILDVAMPGLTGWEVCAKLKTDPTTEDIPVILLTGTDEQDLSERATAMGATALLRKPCPADQLRNTILAATHTNV